MEGRGVVSEWVGVVVPYFKDSFSRVDNICTARIIPKEGADRVMGLLLMICELYARFSGTRKKNENVVLGRNVRR